MTTGDSDKAVPAVYDGPPVERELLCTLQVDGEVFDVYRRADGRTTDYEWVSGPNLDYGFSSSGGLPPTEADHREAITGFLGMIDPATGYIGPD